MVAIHPMAVSGHFWKSRHPSSVRLFRHPDIRTYHFKFFLWFYQYTQRVSSPVGIPNPIVCIERSSTIFMDFAVKSTVILSVFGNIYHTFVGTIKRGIEYFFLIFRTAFHRNLTQSLVPDFTSGVSDSFHIISSDIPLQILLSLFCTDKRDAITHIQLTFSTIKQGNCLSFLSFRINLSFRQHSFFHRRLTGFKIKVDFGGSIIYNLITADTVFFSSQHPVPCIYDQSVITFRMKTDMIDARLMRRSIIYLYIIFIQIYRITVRSDLLQIVRVRHNRTGHIALYRTEIKSGTAPMAGHHYRKSIDPV